MPGAGAARRRARGGGRAADALARSCGELRARRPRGARDRHRCDRRCDRRARGLARPARAPTTEPGDALDAARRSRSSSVAGLAGRHSSWTPTTCRWRAARRAARPGATPTACPPAAARCATSPRATAVAARACARCRVARAAGARRVARRAPGARLRAASPRSTASTAPARAPCSTGVGERRAPALQRANADVVIARRRAAVPPRRRSARTLASASWTPTDKRVQEGLRRRPARAGARVRQDRCATGRSATWPAPTPARWCATCEPIWLMSPSVGVGHAAAGRRPVRRGDLRRGQPDPARGGGAGAVPRARRSIVVGDEMQLPPTSFFSAARDRRRGQLAVEDERRAPSPSCSTPTAS